MNNISAVVFGISLVVTVTLAVGNIRASKLNLERERERIF